MATLLLVTIRMTELWHPFNPKLLADCRYDIPVLFPFPSLLSISLFYFGLLASLVPGAAASAIVWRGSLEDLRARDPRLSNSRYSSLIEPISSDASHVVLNFRYSRRKGGHVSPRSPLTAERESPSHLGAWESAKLSLDFSEARVVYLQPLWLEAVDYLWEGVLGSAVWGGEIQKQDQHDPPHGMAASRGSGRDAGDKKNGVEQAPSSETKLEVEHDRVRISSEIHVSLAAPRLVFPGRLVSPLHLVLQPKTLRYSTWIGGAHDR